MGSPYVSQVGEGKEVKTAEEKTQRKEDNTTATKEVERSNRWVMAQSQLQGMVLHGMNDVYLSNLKLAVFSLLKTIGDEKKSETFTFLEG